MRRCPDCGREFRRQTRHSCAVFHVEDHIAKMTISQEDTWEALRSVVEKLPEVALDAVRSGIEFRVEGALFGIVKRVKGILRLSFLNEGPILSPRVHKTYQSSKRRCYNVVDLATPEDVDIEMEEWLMQAYSLFSGVEDSDWA